VKGLFKLLQKKGDPMVRLIGQQCSLCTFTPSDAKALAKLLLDNKYFWSTHEPLHRDDFYTEEAQYRKILESIQLLQSNREFSFGIYDVNSEQLIGHISLYSIKRLPYSSGFVGYSLDKEFVGRGIATEAVNLVLQFAFYTLNLHRVEAYVAPQNIASVRVLEKSGFKQEGLLRELLFINGVWVDHYMYAMLQSEYKKSRSV
jgi:[ribosomal protein S5]-alanine N-acetyltransferase